MLNRRRLAALASVLVLAACGSTGGSVPPAVTSPSPTGLATSTPAATPPPTAAPSLATAEPSLVTTGGATFCMDRDADPGNVAQAEVVTRSGRRIDIDVAEPLQLHAQPTAADVLLTTHMDSDHIEGLWTARSFPGMKLTAVAGVISLGDVRITGIVAGHGSEAGPASGPDGSDIVFVVETGGLRIVHFGDLGQTSLTPDQLDAIGTPDIAVSQFFNPYSSIDAENHIGFDLMRTVRPHLIVPTHLMNDEPTARLLVATWPSASTTKTCLDLTAARIPKGTSVLFMAYNAEMWAEPLDLPLSKL